MKLIFALGALLLFMSTSAHAAQSCEIVGNVSGRTAALFDVGFFPQGGGIWQDLIVSVDLDTAVNTLNEKIASGVCVKAAKLPTCELGNSALGYSDAEFFLQINSDRSHPDLAGARIPFSLLGFKTDYSRRLMQPLIQLRTQLLKAGVCATNEYSFFTFENGHN